jgi:hypothetical protein
MLKFEDTGSSIAFIQDHNYIAVGTYEKTGFILLYKDTLHQFANAMQAFCFLNNQETI